MYYCLELRDPLQVTHQVTIDRHDFQEAAVAFAIAVKLHQD